MERKRINEIKITVEIAFSVILAMQVCREHRREKHLQPLGFSTSFTPKLAGNTAVFDIEKRKMLVQLGPSFRGLGTAGWV